MPTVSVQFDQKSIARTKKSLMRFQGAPLQSRMEKGTLAVARMLKPAVQAAAPVLQRSGFIGPTKNWPGRLKASIKAYPMRKGVGFIRGARVGPVRVPYSIPLIRGHDLIAWGNPTGMHVAGNPFVDEAVAPRRSEAARLVSQELFKP